MLIAELLAPKSVVTEKGDGPAVDVSGTSNRVFLVTLQICEVEEQESLELTIFGSVDGAAWSAKPLLRFPQRFYRGETPMLLDLREQPDVKFVRAHWDLNRWGRGSEAPRFQAGIYIKEVPREMLANAK